MTIRRIRPRHYKQGYTDMGLVQVPPLPQNILMVDRVTGVQMFLTYVSDIATVSATLPTGLDRTIYGPMEGPYISGRRLFSSNGVLTLGNISIIPLPGYDPTIKHQAVYARVDLSRHIVKITTDDDGNIISTPEDI